MTIFKKFKEKYFSKKKNKIEETRTKAAVSGRDFHDGDLLVNTITRRALEEKLAEMRAKEAVQRRISDQ